MLEVGGGLGVLSEHLAERVAHVHVVELDRALEPALRDALDPHPNTTLHLADAVKLDLAALDPPPTKVVANLPYGVAASVILRTIADSRASRPGSRWCRRRSASASPRAPGRSAYGVPSVLAQLACEVRVLRPVSRTVFHPVPNVDSVLVGPDPPRARARPGAAGARPARASRTAARRSRARSRSRRTRSRASATAPAPRSRRSASRPTRAPSSSRRTSWRALHAELER